MTTSMHRRQAPTRTVTDHEAAVGHRSVSVHLGQHVGRYELLERLGEGGMGTVYRAHDPQLQRDVAIKLIRPERAGSDKDRARFVREARAMAKIDHANVVEIYDSGIADERPFVVMALVRGTTLAGWLAAEPRPARKVVETLLAAGAGLVAAHDAALVHRDFKPSNVLVGDDGSVWVSDFGLARALAQQPGDAPSGGTETTTEDAASLTHTGAILGSPVYMAPEQHDAEAAHCIDARADQFAFAVTVVEALTGERPFTGRTQMALQLEKLQGPPAIDAKTRWLGRHAAALRKALHPDPTQRWPDMRALLGALRSTHTLRSTLARRPVANFAGFAVVALVVVAALLPAAEPPCDQGPQRASEVWNDARRNVLRAALAGSGRAHASETGRRVIAKLDARAAAWSDTYAAACRTAEPVKAQRLACLEQQRVRLGKTVQRLLGADGPTADRALAIAATGATAGRCLQPPEETGEALDSSQQGLAEEIRAQVRHAKRTEHLGRRQEASALAKAAATRARELGYPPLLAFALVTQASALQSTARYDEAAVLLDEATLVAETAGSWKMAAAAQIEAVYLEGNDRRNPERALKLARQAKAALKRMGGHTELELSLATNLGATYHRMGDIDAACAQMRSVLDLRARRPPKYSDDVIRTIAVIGAQQNLGSCLVIARQHQDALPYLRTALQSAIGLFGANNPEVAGLHQALSSALDSTGRYATALEHADRAVALWTPTLPPDDPRLAGAVADRGYVLSSVGRFKESAEALLLASDLLRAAVGSEDTTAWAYRANAVEALVKAGELKRASEIATETHSRIIATTEPADPARANALVASGRVALAQGEAATALGFFEDARDAATAMHGPDDPILTRHHIDVALARQATGDPDGATAALERAVHVASSAPGQAPLHAGDAFFQLAKSVADHDAPRARALARRAHAIYGVHGELPERVDSVQVWLATR